MEPLIRPNFTWRALQPLRLYSAQQNPNEQITNETENDKLYKRLEIELRGHDPMVMKSYVKFATTAANHLEIDVGKWLVIKH